MSYTKQPRIRRDLFEKLLGKCYESAREEIEGDPSGQLMTKLLLASAADEDLQDWKLHFVAFADFGPERYQMFQALGVEFGQRRERIVAAFLISEAWLSVTTEAARRAHPENRIQPSEDPDRKEVLMVIGMTLDLHYASVKRS